ncbi:MAG: glycoside hydrolase 43 family protein [Fimbriimonas sp.]
MATNPILWADVPDPAVIRVGRHYYMSSTTMHMSPGLPIMKSPDLVHWRLVSYAYRTLGDQDELTLNNGKNAYGKGSWASSLRYHNGTFYVSTFSFTTGKTSIYTTEDPERKPWREHTFAPAFHDHSLVFDGDRVFLAYGAGDIRLVELSPDLSGPKRGGFHDVIVRDASRVAGPNVGLKAEGSQLFKVNGKYYLCNITWPRGGMRTQLVHRADRLEGPYEGRIMFQDAGVAQGGMVDTPDGKWYAYLFQDHGAVGRIPYLVPMRWEDGWPVVGLNGKLPAALDIPAGGNPISGIVASDHFRGKTLGPAWQWNHNPDDRHWSLSAKPGALRLTTGRVDESVTQARNTLTQRTFGPECSGTASLDVKGMKDGDRAGLVALMNRYAYVGIAMEGGAKSIVMVNKSGESPTEVARVPFNGDKVHLRMECDFRDGADTVTFAYSLDDKHWMPIGRPHKLAYDLVHFMGCRFGLFNFATKSPGGHVDFDAFRVGNGSDRSRL